jgi:hypothetical protein
VAKITVNFPNRPEGDDIEVTGLGVFKNGYEHQLTDENLMSAQAHGLEIPDEGLLLGDPLPGARLYKQEDQPKEDEEKGGDE